MRNSDLLTLCYPKPAAMWVLAYGSNMHLPDLRTWLSENGHAQGKLIGASPGSLLGFRLSWNYYSRARRGGAANVEEQVGARLHGVALQVDDALLRGIDQKEGHPRVYRRRRVSISLARGGWVDGIVYQVVESRTSSAFIPPTRRYLDLLIAGSIAHGLPEEHIATLRKTPTCD
jgi:cation transport regulator ChaC